ncbi:twisted gastrulation protein homolog 1-A-like [Macrobrachium rosenbergii]|uniref:twisted gastrulation protein homolog 1-A-like n=1 Tax=Macrobrachium rosenbergii TaxID=79674 RepID=UPI0034D589B3
MLALIYLLTIFLSGLVLRADGCNEVVCASMVSKCMLTQACKCDLKNSPLNDCVCCLDCAKCLGYLYTECCSCLGMCEPKTHDFGKRDSQVGDLPEPFPQLFTALTSEKEPQLRWTSMTFPIDVNLSDLEGSSLDKIKYKTVAHPQDAAPAVEQITVNCTVLYMSQCMSSSKCKANCASTGATAYRWFFDGCCECVGGSCINYGVNESRCIECPVVSEEDDFDDDLTDQHLAAVPSNMLDESALQGDIMVDGDPAI